MVHRLHYGVNANFQLQGAPEVLVAHFVQERPPIDELRLAVTQALANPLNYPALQLAVTPGDRIALAIDRSIPRTASVVAGVVDTLLKGGVHPEDITLLMGTAADGTGTPRQDPAGDPTSELPESVLSSVHIESHNPHDRRNLAYLAASREAEPIYLNRRLVDADVVLPISAVSLESSLGYFGVYGGLFPIFSDEETIRRFRAPLNSSTYDQQQHLKEQCDEAAWLLGALFAVQVVPGPRETVLHVVAGEASSVERQGQRLAAEAWLYEAPFRASLVVATIGGGQQQQNWRNLSRALFTAAHAAAEDGAIVLCTELRASPIMSNPTSFARPPAPARSSQAASDLDEESIPTDLLEEVQRRSRVYLLSDLESEVVEDLGIGYVSDVGDIQRLSRHHDTWLLLEDAQHAVVRSPEPLDYESYE